MSIIRDHLWKIVNLLDILGCNIMVKNCYDKICSMNTIFMGRISKDGILKIANDHGNNLLLQAL